MHILGAKPARVFLEVVSKPQIRFKGSRLCEDFASDLNTLRCSKGVRLIEKVVVPSIRAVCEHLPEDCNAVPP